MSELQKSTERHWEYSQLLKSKRMSQLQKNPNQHTKKPPPNLRQKHNLEFWASAAQRKQQEVCQYKKKKNNNLLKFLK